MSMQPPPPPGPFGNQPPPQQQYAAPPPAYAAPPGYVPYGSPGAQGAVKPSKGLSKAMIILFALTTAATAFVAFSLFSRRGVADDVINGNGGDIDAANAMVGVAVLFQLALLLTSAILTCLWAKRIASNAKAKGATSVSPGLAAGGWFIPIGNLFVGFDQLRKSVTGVGGKSPGLNLWQAAFVGQFIMGIFTFRGNDVNLIEPDALSTLRNQGLVALVGAVIYAAATFFASRAAKEIDTAVGGG